MKTKMKIVSRPLFIGFLIIFAVKWINSQEINSKSIVIMWGKVTGTSYPDTATYKDWNDCVSKCVKLDDCVMAAYKSDNEADGCVTYTFYNVTYIQSDSKNKSKIALKGSLPDATCPDVSLKPPMFGKSILRMSIPNKNANVQTVPASDRRLAYTLSPQSDESFMFTYYGCVRGEVQYFDGTTYHCVEKDVTAPVITKDSVCSYYKGSPFEPSTMTKFQMIKSWTRSSGWTSSQSVDYWMSSTLASGCETPSKCAANSRYKGTSGASAVGQWSSKTCTTNSECQSCLILRNGKLLDVDCNTSGNLVCDYEAYTILNKNVVQ